LSDPLEDLVRARPSLAAELPALRRAAESTSAVLVVGESGSGRSTLARALHAASTRSDGPLLELDVAAVPASLFESDLFGHAVGSFTGAVRARRGAVERATAGTLVLDHVEELPLEVQPKLLRVLAEQRYSPIGGRDRRADVRFIAIAADDLEQRRDAGAFRADLYYRLEVLAFRVPPLRRRRRDLGPLIEVMLRDLALRHGRGGLSLAESAWRWMREHPWPGNVRQLRNVLERSVVLDRQSDILSPPPPGGSAEPRTLLELEREAIRDALAFTRGHQGRAAELLGISRKALWEKRRRHQLP
jgi:DNA-binding NtrC family response regulator